MSVLVYHAGALGDFVTILPLLAAQRRLNPNRRTVLLGRPAHGELARCSGFIDQTWDVDSAQFNPLFSDARLTEAHRLLEPFDTVVAFAAPDSGLLRVCQSAPRLRLLWQPPFPSDGTHVVDYHLELAGETPLSDDDRVPRVHLPVGETVVERYGLQTPYVVIQPGSGGKRKNWPLERFERCGQRLADEGWSLVWVTGPAEESFPAPNGRLVSSPPLTDLAGLLERARLYLGNDSGVTHLAAAAGAPCATIFGPSDPSVWGPRGTGPVEVITQSAPCSPCHGNPVDLNRCNRWCIESIDVDTVLDACFRLLGAGRREA